MTWAVDESSEGRQSQPQSSTVCSCSRMISNLKRYLMGTFHGVSKEYLQKWTPLFIAVLTDHSLYKYMIFKNDFFQIIAGP